MSNILPFNYEGAPIRTVTIDGEPWFILADVARVLGISQPHAIARRLDPRDRKMTRINSAGHNRRGYVDATIVNESGLYDVVLDSRKPEARRFRRWITNEVIPSIRKHGAYVTPSKLEELAYDPRAMAKLLNDLADDLDAAQAKIEADAPKLAAYEAYGITGRNMEVGEFAKLLNQNGFDTGRNRFFAWLRDNGWLMNQLSQYNNHTQKARNLGLFKVDYYRPNDYTPTKYKPYLTPRGQAYFLERFLDGRFTLEDRDLDFV